MAPAIGRVASARGTRRGRCLCWEGVLPGRRESGAGGGAMLARAGSRALPGLGLLQVGRREASGTGRGMRGTSGGRAGGVPGVGGAEETGGDPGWGSSGLVVVGR